MKRFCCAKEMPAPTTTGNRYAARTGKRSGVRRDGKQSGDDDRDNAN